jgi:hypothetical protein
MIDLQNPSGNLDAAQTMLGFTSMLPGAQPVALLNAAISQMRGDSGNAALNAATVLPLGQIGKIGKLTKEASALERAAEIANSMGKTKDFVTIAVTDTKQGVRIVSSSENALRLAQRGLLKEGEIAVKGAGHAEVTGLNAAKQLGLTPIGVAASRTMCWSCVVSVAKALFNSMP